VSSIVGKDRSAGQVSNLLPSCRIGLLFDFDIFCKKGAIKRNDHFYLFVEAGIDYFPFARDVDHYKGLGAYSIPVSVSGQIPLGNYGLLSIGGGVQLTRMEFGQVPRAYKAFNNPIFVTYFVELGLGHGTYEGVIFLDYQFFARLEWEWEHTNL
jgi:hypothetical protein